MPPIEEAVQAVAMCLNIRKDFCWAIVGGACLYMRGSGRQTDDVDIVIAPPTQVGHAKDTLKQDSRFTVMQKTRSVSYKASNGEDVSIQFLSHPGTFPSEFWDMDQVDILPGAISCLSLDTMLDSKCAAYPKRSTQEKKETDAKDIQYILKRAVDAGQKFRLWQVPHASIEFINQFEIFHVGSKLMFRKLGLVPAEGN